MLGVKTTDTREPKFSRYTCVRNFQYTSTIFFPEAAMSDWALLGTRGSISDATQVRAQERVVVFAVCVKDA